MLWDNGKKSGEMGASEEKEKWRSAPDATPRQPLQVPPRPSQPYVCSSV